MKPWSNRWEWSKYCKKETVKKEKLKVRKWVYLPLMKRDRSSSRKKINPGSKTSQDCLQWFIQNVTREAGSNESFYWLLVDSFPGTKELRHVFDGRRVRIGQKHYPLRGRHVFARLERKWPGNEFPRRLCNPLLQYDFIMPAVTSHYYTLHSGQTTRHSREHARHLRTSGHFPSSSHKISTVKLRLSSHLGTKFKHSGPTNVLFPSFPA